VHWVIWNIPADVLELAEHTATTTEVVSIGPNVRQGANDYRGIGYAGPGPPPNVQAISSNTQQLRGLTRQKPHKYSFTIYALDVKLDLAAGANKNELLEAMDGHIVASGELAGEYVNKILYK
jgi:Raf kinase inhibitor-like YbhB/YbcL family protein